MKTKVSEILQQKEPKVISVKPESTVYEAIQAMVNHNIGSVLVISHEAKLVGIFTERDVLNQCIRRSDELRETDVQSVMTTDLIIGLPGDEVDYLLGIMANNKIRHLPILEDGEVLGVVSIGDLVKSRLKNIEFENRYLKDYIMGKYPA